MTVERLQIDYPVSRERAIAVGQLRCGRFPPEQAAHDTEWLVGIELAAPARVQAHEMPAGALLVLDPRCLVRHADTGDVRYNPREHLADLGPTFVTWMREHPNWPARLLG